MPNFHKKDAAILFRLSLLAGGRDTESGLLDILSPAIRDVYQKSWAVAVLSPVHP